MNITNFIIASVIVGLIASCSSSKKVVNNGVISKRKYNNGFFLSFKSKKDKATSNEILHNNQGVVKSITLSENKEHIALADKKTSKVEIVAEHILNNVSQMYEKNSASEELISANTNKKTTFVKTDKGIVKNIVNASKKYISSAPLSGDKGKSVASLILGILSILTCWLPYVGLLMGIAGIILGVLGLKRENARGLAIAGLVCSIVGTLLGLWPLLFAAALFRL